MTETAATGASGDPLEVVLVNHTDTVRPEVEMLTQGLASEAVELTVFLPESARSSLSRDADVTYRFYDATIVPTVRYTLPHPSFRRALADALTDASVLHVLGYVYPPCLVAGLTARGRDVGTILTVDAFPGVSWTYGNRAVDAIAAAYSHTLGRATLSLPDCAVGIGEYLRNDLERFTTADVDVRIVPNGVDTDRYRPDLAVESGPRPHATDADTVELLYVGRLDTVKGVPYLLRAVSGLDDRYRLTIVGDGSRRAEYEQLTVDLGIEHRVSFEGYQPDVRPYYTTADLFVLPSLSEGLPTVVLEAQACGLPVVSTDVGGVREMVRGGQVVPTADPSALRSAIETVAGGDRAQRGRVARDHVVSAFTLEEMAATYADLYREVASSDRQCRFATTSN